MKSVCAALRFAFFAPGNDPDCLAAPDGILRSATASAPLSPPSGRTNGGPVEPLRCWTFKRSRILSNRKPSATR